MNRQLLKNIIEILREGLLKPDTEKILRTKLADFRLTNESTVISGVRRCGKSYLLKLFALQVATEYEILYLNFEDPRLLSFSADDFEVAYELFLGGIPDLTKPIAILLDEPQMVDGWEHWANFFAEKPNHLIGITGSNSKLLSSDLATYLTGRHRVIELFPLSFREVVGNSLLPFEGDREKKRAQVQKHFDRYLKLGGFPRVWRSEDVELLGQYYKDIVLKDISTRKGTAPARVNMELGLYLMSNAAQQINKTKLAKLFGFKQQRTITKHISAFIDTYLFTEVKLFSPSPRKQMRSLSKYYPIDHALARQIRFTVFDDLSLSLEIMVAGELRRRGFEIFYWRSSKNYEVDFIARKMGQGLIAVQVSLDLEDPAVFEREVRSLQACYQELGIHSLVVITLFDSTTLTPPPADLDAPSIEVRSFTEWALG